MAFWSRPTTHMRAALVCATLAARCALADPPAAAASAADDYAAARVRAVFAHAWRGYEEHAFGSDELLPLRNASTDRWGALAVTMVARILFARTLHPTSLPMDQAEDRRPRENELSRWHLTLVLNMSVQR